MDNECSITIQLSVTCSACGGDVKAKADRWGTGIEVAPCEKCMDESFSDGVDQGKKESDNG